MYYLVDWVCPLRMNNIYFFYHQITKNLLIF
jgi:hypothetical protein